MQPAQSSDTGDGLSSCLPEQRGFPMLSVEAERVLCYRWRDRHDISAARQLTGSHLHLVVKVAREYRAYGLPTEDLVAEGHVGLMRAVCRFDPDCGVRFATYAIWWIHVAIQTCILRNWSLVNMRTTASQKKLLFDLRRVSGPLLISEYSSPHTESVSTIAEMVQVAEHDVTSMDQRPASPDLRPNTPVGPDGEGLWQTWPSNESDDPEANLTVATAQKRPELQPTLGDIMRQERNVGLDRRRETPTTLRAFLRHYGISSEEIRQMAAPAFLNCDAGFGQSRRGGSRP